MKPEGPAPYLGQATARAAHFLLDRQRIKKEARC